VTSEFDWRFDPSSQVSVARWYFALQALAGAVWWATVPASEWVREQTLAELPAAVLVVPDLLLFVVASAVAAWRSHERLGSLLEDLAFDPDPEVVATQLEAAIAEASQAVDAMRAGARQLDHYGG